MTGEPILRVAADFLRRHHELTVVGAICGSEEALAQAQHLQPQVILIGLDGPGLTDLEAITCLRNMLPGVGIIALILLEGNVCRQTVVVDGVDDLVRKAELVTELLPAIRRVMQAKRSQQGLAGTIVHLLIEPGNRYRKTGALDRGRLPEKVMVVSEEYPSTKQR